MHAAALAPRGAPLPLGRGVGGSATGWLGRLAAVDLADLHVAAPTVAMGRDRTGFFGLTWVDGTLGAPILERTLLILDYSRGRVIFEKQPDFAAPFAADGSGLKLTAAAPDYAAVTVHFVIPGSPAAAAAGIEAGDSLLEIDGQPVTGRTLCDTARRLEGLEGNDVTRHLVLRRHGRSFEASIWLRPLL